MSDAVYEPDWALPANVHAVMTTRRGGGSKGSFKSFNLGVYVGDPDAERNREALVGLAGLPSSPLWLHQVHSTRCLHARGVLPETEADASWTADTGVVLAALAADCLPVLFAADDGSCVAASHAGWRGLAGGVLENTLAAMPVPTQATRAWLGPAIGQSAFEVGAEVREAFCDLYPDDADHFIGGDALGKYRADLFGLARARLLRSGVRSISGGGVCTVANAGTCFSHRRDAGRSGRMAALIWRR